MQLLMIENRYGRTVEFIAQRAGGWGTGPGRRPGHGTQVDRDPPVPVAPGDHALPGSGVEIPLYMLGDQGSTDPGFDAGASFAANRMFFRVDGQELWSFAVFDNSTIIGAAGADFSHRAEVPVAGNRPARLVVVTIAAGGLTVREASFSDLMRRYVLLSRQA
ncbi:MAG: hypothetical protein VYB54_08480 [Pseudomonadota bacterium]|nr:hypothetical protein [Pseudomonadota bacterium]